MSTLRGCRLLFLAALTIGASVGSGCSSSSQRAGSGNPAGVYCVVGGASVTSCYGYSNLTSTQQSAVSQACTQALQGKIAGSCPTQGQVGCCTTNVSGYAQTQCDYAASAAELEAACKASSGTWSGGNPGDGGAGSSDGSSGSSGSSGSGSGSSAGSGSGSGSGSSSGSGSGSSSGNGCTVCPNGCVDLQNDPGNCGSCEYACPQGAAGTTPSCSNAACVYTCNDSAETYCSDAQRCIDTQTDVNNCGQCGRDCSAALPSGVNQDALKGLTCQGGQCQAQIDGIAIEDCTSSSDPRCAMTCDQICQAQNLVPCAPSETVSECGLAGGCAGYEIGSPSLCFVSVGCTGTQPYSTTSCEGSSGNLDEIWCQCSGTFSY